MHDWMIDVCSGHVRAGWDNEQTSCSSCNATLMAAPMLVVQHVVFTPEMNDSILVYAVTPSNHMGIGERWVQSSVSQGETTSRTLVAT